MLGVMGRRLQPTAPTTDWSAEMEVAVQLALAFHNMAQNAQDVALTPRDNPTDVWTQEVETAYLQNPCVLPHAQSRARSRWHRSEKRFEQIASSLLEPAQPWFKCHVCRRSQVTRTPTSRFICEGCLREIAESYTTTVTDEGGAVPRFPP